MTFMRILHPIKSRRFLKAANAPWVPPLAPAPLPDPQGRTPLPASAWGYEAAKVAANQQVGS